MPDRVIRDELLASDRWLGLNRNTHRLAFVTLLLRCDALGNMECSDGALWRVWRDPLGLTDKSAIPEILGAMVEADLVRLYDVDDELSTGKKRYLHIPRTRFALRFVRKVLPVSPWTTQEQKQALEKNSPREHHERTKSERRAHTERTAKDKDKDKDKDKVASETCSSSPPGLGSRAARARATATPKPGGDKSPVDGQPNGNGPPPPVRNSRDEAGIEALARYFGKWPLTGEAGHDWQTAMRYVNTLREQHFRGQPA